MTEFSNVPAVDPEVAAQLDAADTRESPGAGRDTPPAQPDEMSAVIERADAQRTDPKTGDNLHPESLRDGQEW